MLPYTDRSTDIEKIGIQKTRKGTFEYRILRTLTSKRKQTVKTLTCIHCKKRLSFFPSPAGM
jgi:hypothetical protein